MFDYSNFNFDTPPQDPEKLQEEDIPDGTYDAQIMNVEESKDTEGYSRLVFTFALRGIRRRLKVYMPTQPKGFFFTEERIQARMYQLTNAFGLKPTRDLWDWQLKKGRITTTHRVSKKDGKEYVNVAEFLPPESDCANFEEIPF